MRMYKRKPLILCLCLFLSLLYLFPPCARAQFESPAGAAILMEASTGEVLYEKNADEAMPPASITKIMTLYIAFEALEKGDVAWDDLVTISVKSWKTEGSRMFLEAGKKVKFGDIIQGISIVSANDGCVAVAEHLYGSEEAFVEVMNQKAKELGLTKTQFKNSTGLPAEGHYMSARDIAVLARRLIERFPQILEIESQREFTFNNIKQPNRNPLLGVFPGADGLKTGWTNEAGYCLVGTAKQKDMRLISVVLNTKDEKERLSASSELLNYGFKNYEIAKISKAGTVIGEVPVKNGKEKTVSVKIGQSVTTVIPTAKKNDIQFVLKEDEEALNAPIEKDAPVGSVDIMLEGKTLATVDALATAEVPRAGFFEILFRSIIDFFKSLFRVSIG